VIDDYKGAFMATEHLIQKGYKRIAHISGPQHLKNFYDRLKGYMGALQAHKIPVDLSLIYSGNISIESGRQGMKHFLSLSNPPDAVFAVEDFTALGVISVAKEQKIDIPSDLGVIGFANEQFGEHITPRLSTIDQQTIQMGKSSLTLLLDLIEKKENGDHRQQKVVLEPLLISRDSSERGRKLGEMDD
jgi:LacI family transcriptional regulator